MLASGSTPDFRPLPWPQQPAAPRSDADTQRPTSRAQAEVLFASFRLLPTQFLLLEGDEPVPLGSRALEILIVLLERPGELIGKRELMERVWPDVFVGPANLTVHISALRRRAARRTRRKPVHHQHPWAGLQVRRSGSRGPSEGAAREREPRGTPAGSSEPARPARPTRHRRPFAGVGPARLRRASIERGEIDEPRARMKSTTIAAGFSERPRSASRPRALRACARRTWRPRPQATALPRSVSRRRRSSLPTFASASRRPAGPTGSRSPTTARACGSPPRRQLASYWATRLRLAQRRGAAQRPAAVHHRDRRAGHPLHPRPLAARERAAGDRHPRVARLDHRADEDRRATDRPDGPRRERGGCLPRRHSVPAGLRLLGQADEAGMEPARASPRPGRR